VEYEKLRGGGGGGVVKIVRMIEGLARYK